MAAGGGSKLPLAPQRVQDARGRDVRCDLQRDCIVVLGDVLGTDFARVDAVVEVRDGRKYAFALSIRSVCFLVCRECLYTKCERRSHWDRRLRFVDWGCGCSKSIWGPVRIGQCQLLRTQDGGVFSEKEDQKSQLEKFVFGVVDVSVCVCCCFRKDIFASAILRLY